MFLGYLYVQLDILQSDEKQVGSYHIITTFAHSTIFQHMLWERCARHLAKCKSIHFAKEKYLSEVITDFVVILNLTFHWLTIWLS